MFEEHSINLRDRPKVFQITAYKLASHLLTFCHAKHSNAKSLTTAIIIAQVKLLLFDYLPPPTLTGCFFLLKKIQDADALFGKRRQRGPIPSHNYLFP